MCTTEFAIENSYDEVIFENLEMQDHRDRLNREKSGDFRKEII